MTIYEKLIAIGKQIELLEEDNPAGRMVSSAKCCHTDAFKCLKHGQDVYAEQWAERAAKYLWGFMRPEHWSK